MGEPCPVFDLVMWRLSGASGETWGRRLQGRGLLGAVSHWALGDLTALSLGKEDFRGLPDYRQPRLVGVMWSRESSLSLTSGEPPDRTGPQDSWEGYLIDLSLPAPTACGGLPAKTSHGGGFDLCRVIVALATSAAAQSPVT